MAAGRLGLKGRDLLTLDELSGEDITRILDVADALKQEKRTGQFRPLLAHKSLAMVFQKPSTRTRASFEVGMFELGGQALNLSSSELQLARGETISDTARTLEGYVDVIMARVDRHQDVVDLATAARVPVINGLSDLYHPCQILADLQTIREVYGRLQGLRLAWIGDGNNVCNTLALGAAKVGMDMNVASPDEHRPLPAAVHRAQEIARRTGSRIALTPEPAEAVRGADVVVTDTFVSMGMDAEREQRLARFLPRYQVTPQLLEQAKPACIFMHCLPAHRGEEVVDAVIDGSHSRVWQEAENRLHAQKALLCLLMLDSAELPW